MNKKIFNFIRISAALLTAAVLTLACGCGKSKEKEYPAATQKFFINDFADVIAEDDENYIYGVGEDIYVKTTAQVVAVTVKTTGDESIEDYALNLGRKWQIGNEEKDNGIVILVATDDRKIYIAVGYGLEGALPDSKVGRIIDYYGLEYFADDNFSTGLRSVYNTVANEILVEYGIDPYDDYTPADELETKNSDGGFPDVLGYIGLAVLVIIIIIAVLARSRFGGPRGGFGGFGGGMTFGSGFGSSGGGFRSGGNGGGFSGGGGSFGGGGAGRSF